MAVQIVVVCHHDGIVGHWNRTVGLGSHGRRHRMQKRPILRLSLVSPCMYWNKRSLTFSASGLHIGLVHDLLKLCQHCRFGL